ncbi:MAG: glycoside hydrolase family 13 protein [Bacteroidales bacterium]|nr:glycoside hydrolase family 13 protein [Bacteroidales bacterium]
MKILKLNLVTSLILLMSVLNVFAQKTKIDHIEPPNWWVGMQQSELQILIHGDHISDYKVSIDQAGIDLKSVLQLESPNYLFLKIEIDPKTQACEFPILFKNNNQQEISINYSLLEREEGSATRKGFDNSDVMYLLMPDRFANGDINNDSPKGMREKAKRTDPNGRHGGDIRGVINHLDYLKDLGITQLWLNPFVENNQDTYSYHGYAITNFYNTDARCGTNEDIKELTSKLKANGMGLIMDMIMNHCGNNHWWMKDLPSNDWVNQWPEFTRSNYRGGVITDPHASEYDFDKMSKGWFDVSMPDLNQQNPVLAKYLIQNSIWWVEYAGLTGIRMDTYPYPDRTFMAEWAKAVMTEYPNFNMVGEAWMSLPSSVAYWQKDGHFKDGYQSHLPTVFDFPMMYAIAKAFNENDGWDTGTARLYEVLTHDFLYSAPENLVLFADNHDGDRFATKIQSDIKKFKMAMSFLMTTRGTPQLYYGTEIMMTGEEHKGHGFIREDFPGGWSGDKMNAFSGNGLNKTQGAAQDFTRKLLNWRKSNEVIHKGELTHFIPENGIYVYFRTYKEQSVMVILNNNDKDFFVDADRYAENLVDFKKGINVMTGESFKLDKISVSAKSACIIELHR